jgi:hypothetical protein
MISTLDLPMSKTSGNDESIAAPATVSGVFADIVFDRPLDHAYSYAVPSELVDRIGVGKRVEAPFGRGDKATIGYCVRVHEVPPLRTVKSISRVVDDDALLTDSLLRLTRWMADYYLCGWGQVLQAVLPAGVRDQAGTREAVFVEAVPDSELRSPIPELTAKQAQTLEKVRKIGGPVEQRKLFREVKVGPGVVKALIDKGLLRKHHERVERTDIVDDADRPNASPITMNGDQERVWTPVAESAWCDWIRKDGDLSTRHRRGDSQRQGSVGTGSGNLAHAADDRTVSWPLRKRRGYAQSSFRRRARRALAAHRGRASASRRRCSQRRLCAMPQPRVDGYRRRAREHVQTRNDAALPRSRCRRDAREARRHPDPTRLSDAVARKLGER